MSGVDKSCHSCKLGFDLNVRRPKILLCSHTLCTYCINDSLENKKCIHCSLCRVDSGANISDLPDNERILEKLKEDYIGCSHHEGVPATHLDSKTLESLCEECYSARSQKNLINLEDIDFSEILQNRWRDLSSELNGLPYILKKKYWNCKNESNQKKLEFCYKIAAFKSTEIFCDTHPFVSAKWISRATLEPLCENCSQKCKEIMPIEDDDTEEFINGVLYQKIYSSDLACIPSIYYEYIKNYGWKLKDMIDLHRFLKESEGKEKITEKTKCPICLSNFGFGWDTPMKLSCSEANHAVCLKCFSSAGSNFRCPLDNKECEMSNPTPLEVDDLFSYPWCRGCNEIMGKNQNIPVKSKCIHPMCKECEWCQICKDYVIEDKNVIDKNLSKKLEFMETYCLEHKEPAIKFKKEFWEVQLLNIEIRTFPKVCCKNCKGGSFNLRNKDYFKMFDTLVQDAFYCLVENLSRLDIRYQEIAEECKGDFTISNYNQRLEKIQEIAQILEGLSQPNQMIKEEKILNRFEGIYPYDGRPTKGWRVSKDQVESISLTCSRNIALLGLILGGDVSGATIHADIYIACSENIIVDDQSHIKNFEIKSKEEQIRFANMIELTAETKYTISVIYDNIGGILFNGIPAKRKIKLECSIYEIEVESPKNNGQYRLYRNDIGGPILGFIIS